MRNTGTHDGEQLRQQQNLITLDTETDEARTGPLVSRDESPTPLLSPTVDKEQHAAICGLIHMHANEKSREL